MSEFSVELAAEQIVDARTKSYFTEVLSSFINGHYRSTAVMLWSVVISDLVYKLQELRDLYQDPVATSILDSVGARQAANPTNPEWEPYLLDEVNSRTQFFEAGEHQHIVAIHKLRHLSAHPVLSSAHLLFEPNKETARAAIRNALECVLLKPPVFSRKVVINLIEDLAARRALLPDTTSLRMYLEAKYLRSLHPTVKLELIRTLWKFCFRLSNPDADANREINFRALKVIHDRDALDFRNVIRQNADQFSEVAAGGAPLMAVVRFLAKCDGIYPTLTHAAKIPIAAFARTDVNLLADASYINDSLAAHIAELSGLPVEQLSNLSDDSWLALLAKADGANLRQEALEIAIKLYCASSGFNTADSLFARFIRLHAAEFDTTRMTQVLAGIERNNQTYWRWQARTDHPLLKARADELGVDLAPYPNFRESLPQQVG
ncbi:MAG TPA: hypothetical protein VFW59_00255 [Gallionella sp.]|nr:hypothetical protein [Gallionella sp.]